MAFAQQQRRPRYRSHLLDTSSEDQPILSPVESSSAINHVLSPGPIHSATAVNVVPSLSSTSDSETDWHVVSAGLQSSPSISSTNTPASRSSPTHIDRRDSMEPPSSDPESFSSFRPSDTESFSDNDFAFDVLPSHDGTGAFMVSDMDPTSEEDTTALSYRQQTLAADQSSPEQHTLVEGINTRILSASFRDFEPNTPSMPNILLPYGGIHSPSFAPSTNSNNLIDTLHNTTPTFQPTVDSKALTVSSDEHPSDTLSQQQQEDSSTTTSSADHIKFTRKRPKNLDSIPTHHPSLPGSITSFALLSALWNNLRRLTNHLIENDTYTADAFTSLVSEATLDGCLPFGSHLHMELAAGLRPAYSNRRYEGLPGM